MLLMLDNYDSFTFNLVQYCRELTQDVVVFRNDAISLEEIVQLKPQHIIISPGPGRPENAGITIPLIRTFAGKIPILGVCLGHQAIAQTFGASIIHAKKVMHGKTSYINHTNQGVFTNLPSAFTATRYHSLVVDSNTLPQELLISAWSTTANNELEIMGIKHHTFALEGVQFHPESILSEAGHQLLANFLQQNNTLVANPEKLSMMA